MGIFLTITQQRRILAGMMGLGFLFLSVSLHPVFLIGNFLLSLGLLFSGISNICLLEKVLIQMPWNK